MDDIRYRVGMGAIEISDGTTNREIPVREIDGRIRLETGGDRCVVVVPERYTVVRASTEGRPEPTGTDAVKHRIDEYARL